MIVKRRNRREVYSQKRILRIKSIHTGEEHDEQIDLTHVCILMTTGISTEMKLAARITSSSPTPHLGVTIDNYTDNKITTSTLTRTVLRHSSSVRRPVLEMILIKYHLLLPSIQHGEQTSPWSSLGNRLMHRPSMMDIPAVVVGMTLYRRNVRLLLLLLLRGRMLRLNLARTLMRWRTMQRRLVPGRTTI
jgi:hypothetical protein